MLNDGDFIKELKAKVIEEASELSESETIDDVKNEIVDVLEDVNHMIEVYGIEKSELERLQESKQQKYGNFSKRIKTHYVEMSDNHEEVAYYESKPHKYPLID